MDEESSSWIRRAKYSHTVCHRLDSSKLASVPLRFRTVEIPKFKPKVPDTAPVRKVGEPYQPQIQKNPLTNKQRSVSPLPETIVSDTFKEARLEKKRSSTPLPRRKESDKKTIDFSFSFDSPDGRKSNGRNTSPLRSFSPMKSFGRLKQKKDSGWAKYFDHGGGKVTSVEAADDYMVDLSQLFLGLRFAHGAHSRLYHGIYKDEPVAVKIIRVPDDDENGNLASRLEKQFNREVSLLSRLHHPNVIKFVAACRQPPVFCIVAEYLSEGSLRSYLHKLENETLPLQKLIPVALNIARGMDYVHSQGVIHRDLKPENVLIDQSFRMKIADFGIACEEVHCDPFADDPGTYRWMAPEMIRHKPYGRKVDVYSFGLMLWEMVSGNIPYEDMTPIQAAYAVVNKNLRPAFPKSCPPAMRALIEQCWSAQPEKRPEFWQVVKVLEQFESSLAHDGTLNSVQNSIFQDHRKGFLHWIQKLGPPHPHSKSMPKPKFN
ncbi:serine/threonine-protein kinase HT1-like [Chenopodium quinoa]|uniref:Protein kinase domain-containing protein n=1 Tax=Chenopodium quinoa TaxID=63459 RepID=A0A803LLI0_CHEQI|nr:serine/threonine-protein kinase HT1-like [Chenopodium quinoa]XP_021726459.1 serine/threonine-protein kinase HT1-like [Chenopodium quinoa]